MDVICIYEVGGNIGVLKITRFVLKCVLERERVRESLSFFWGKIIIFFFFHFLYIYFSPVFSVSLTWWINFIRLLYDNYLGYPNFNARKISIFFSFFHSGLFSSFFCVYVEKIDPVLCSSSGLIPKMNYRLIVYGHFYVVYRIIGEKS